MHLRLFGQGAAFSIWVIDLSDDPDVEDCPVLDFLEDLKAHAPKSYASMVAVITRHRDHGRILNPRKSRDEGKGILEFKNRDGMRIMYFYLPGKITVLTHGFKKGAKLAQERRRALAWKLEAEKLS